MFVGILSIIVITDIAGVLVKLPTTANKSCPQLMSWSHEAL